MNQDVILQKLNCVSIEEALNSYLLNPSPTTVENNLILELLRSQSISDINTKSSIICHVTGMYVATCCRLNECKYHINSFDSANCLLVYMDRQKNEGVSLGLQQLFYGVSKSELKQSLISAILKVRSTYFKDWANVSNIPTFQFYETLKVCCNCESAIDKPFFTKYGHAWCSNDCLEQFPSNTLRFEKAFGVPFIKLDGYLNKCFPDKIVKEIFQLY